MSVASHDEPLSPAEERLVAEIVKLQDRVADLGMQVRAHENELEALRRASNKT